MTGRPRVRTPWGALALLVLASAALRTAVAVRWPSAARPDEVFQNLEPAYRLWTGWGFVPWEWREGIRSWLFPGFLSGVMQLTDVLHWPHAWAEPLVWAVLSLLAGLAVGVGALIGWRLQGWLGAVLCGLLGAVWPDLVYYGPRSLGEVQSGHLLAIAAGLAVLVPRERLRGGWLVAIGGLLGLAFDLRFQLAPTLAIVAVWAARWDGRRWVSLLAGAAVPVAVMGGLDWASWGTPFQSVWKNVWINLFEGKAAEYGTEPVGWYGLELARRFGAALVPIGYGAYRGARLAPLLAAVVLSVILMHSAIAHKEYSFIYAALPPLFVLAGLGLAEMLAQLGEAVGRRRLVAVTAVTCLVTAGVVGLAQPPAAAYSDTVHGLDAAWRVLRGRPDLCGIGLLGGPAPWQLTPGYAGLQREVPILLLNDREELAEAQTGFNYLVAPGPEARTLGGYSRVACASGWCVFHRAQACAPVPVFEVNASLARRGV